MTARRRLIPRWVLVLLLLVMPLLELYVLIQVGQVVGAWWTILLLITSSVVGAWLIRREGVRAWRALVDALGSGRLPTKELADGVLVLLGGLLLMVPGFVSDVIGLFLVLPGTRALARAGLVAFAGRHLVMTTTNARRPGPGDSGPVVQGEVIDP